MSSEAKEERRAFFPEGNYTFPELENPDIGFKRFYEALAKSGLPGDKLEFVDMVIAAKTEEEWEFINKRIPLWPLIAVFMKKRMGKAEFLAQGYNLDYANGELGGPDWVDKY